MNKYVRLALIALLAVIMIFSGVQLFGILKEYGAASSAYDDISGGAVLESPDVVSEGDAPLLSAPITVDFDALRQINEDVIGWIYCEDTQINYPVVQGVDNDYYLHYLIDGTYNASGSIFVDARCSGDFSDPYTIIYGHNMKNGSMFAGIKKFHSQKYYEEHPVMWLLTPERTYLLELVAGYTTDATSKAFVLYDDWASMQEYLAHALKWTNFIAPVDPASVEHLVSLATCSYEHDTARFVLLGSLVPLDEINSGERPMPAALTGGVTSASDAPEVG